MPDDIGMLGRYKNSALYITNATGTQGLYLEYNIKMRKVGGSTFDVLLVHVQELIVYI